MNKNYDELISDAYLNDLPIAQGGNSQVYKVNFDGQNYGIKYYDSKHGRTYSSNRWCRIHWLSHGS